MTKQCTKCKKEKPLENFGTYKNQKWREGKHMPRCKECMKEYHRLWLEKNRDKYNEYQAEYKRNKNREKSL
jgi:hypothetical protein